MSLVSAKSFAVVLFVLFLSVRAIPKLPMYIGNGYDVLTGNPLSGEGVDPGFQHEIFEFSYFKN